MIQAPRVPHTVNGRSRTWLKTGNASQTWSDWVPRRRAMRLPAGACSGSLWVSIQYEDLYGDPGFRRATAADTQSSSQEVLTMPAQNEGRVSGDFNFYGPQYARFGSALAAELRREAFGEDLGQQGWRTAEEQAEIASLLGLAPDDRVLDVACGAGGPSLDLVERTGCRLTGLDRGRRPRLRPGPGRRARARRPGELRPRGLRRPAALRGRRP